MIRTKKNISPAPLSTFKIGNRAEFFCRVKNDTELHEAIKWAKKRKLTYKVFAGGSNVVFPDKKLKGLLIQIRGGTIRASARRLVRQGRNGGGSLGAGGNGRTIVADAGVPLADVIKVAISRGLKGLETLSGIPGTVGGAVVGNAGAYGHSISEVVERVEVLNAAGGIEWLTKKDLKFGYRESVIKHKPYLLLKAVLKFKKGNPEELRKISREIIKVRKRKYKPGLRCPGSFFKNVLVKDVSKKTLKKIDNSKIIDGKIPAGYLLEEVGAKGMRVGGIKIADFHGNLFVNAGRAKAKDVKRLAGILRRKVRNRFGIKLEEEIKYF